jgi:nickel-dependent lactate racemase
MIRVCLVAAALLWPGPAQAFPCWMVRQAVAQYGAAAVESWAKARGVPEKDIEKARRCFSDGFVASLPKR